MRLIRVVRRLLGVPESEEGVDGTIQLLGCPNRGRKPADPPASASGASASSASNQSCTMPLLSEVPLAEKADLFRRKLEACSVLYDFSNTKGWAEEKEAKRLMLLEIVEYTESTRNCFNEWNLHAIINMVSSNIFRALPTSRGRKPVRSTNDFEAEPTLETAWPHLQIVYECLLRLVVSNDVDPMIAKRFVDQTFITKLLELFDSEDPREREYLKTILHRIYGKFMALRSFIRRAIQQVFFRVIVERENHNGVGELLDILGSISNGFAQPLKDEHKDFLLRALIPLHKVRTVVHFHQQLCYCMSQYVEKDPRLACDVIMAILRYWPVSFTRKQIAFLDELEETLELTQPWVFHRVQERLSQRIANCITSPHFQVAERVLLFWNNENVVKLIDQNRHMLYPKILPALIKNSKHHWHSGVHGLTYNVLRLLMQNDVELCDRCSAEVRESEAEEDRNQRLRAHRWRLVHSLHDANVNNAR